MNYELATPFNPHSNKDMTGHELEFTKNIEDFSLRLNRIIIANRTTDGKNFV